MSKRIPDKTCRLCCLYTLARRFSMISSFKIDPLPWREWLCPSAASVSRFAHVGGGQPYCLWDSRNPTLAHTGDGGRRRPWAGQNWAFLGEEIRPSDWSGGKFPAQCLCAVTETDSVCLWRVVALQALAVPSISKPTTWARLESLSYQHLLLSGKIIQDRQYVST